MNPTYKLTLIAAAGIFALGSSVAVGTKIGKSLCPTAMSSAIPQGTSAMVFPDVVPLPFNTMDSTYAIPGTSVTIAYPKDGFYGFGVKILPENSDPERGSFGGVGIIPNTEPDIERPVELSVGVYELKQGDSLERMAENGRISSLEIGKDDGSGILMTINGHKFFVNKRLNNNRSSSWRAVSVGNKEVVVLTFTFSLGNDALSNTAFRNDDALFFQVLNHITFE